MTLRKKLAILTTSLKSSQKPFFKVNYIYFNKLSIIFKMLVEHGYLFGIKIKDSKLVIQCKQTCTLYDLKLMVTGRAYFSFYQLQAKIKNYPLSIFFIYTDLGVLDNTKILLFKIGGYLILILKHKHVTL